MIMRKKPSTIEEPKAVFKAAVAALRRKRLRRARIEDALDKRWERQCDRTWRKLAAESGLTGFDLFLFASGKMPSHPPGWFERRQVCNRCGSKIQRSLEHDAYYCASCPRWIEPRCRDPRCQYCRLRPKLPGP